MSLKLQKPLLVDTAIIAKYANNINIWLNVTDGFPFPYFEENAIEFVNHINSQKPQQVFKITKNNDFVGFIGITPKKSIYRKTAELGYWIAEPFWGKGFATQAVKKILEYAFITFKQVIKYYAKVYHTNKASMRVLEKNGFKKEAVLKKQVIKANEIKDLHYYSLFC